MGSSVCLSVLSVTFLVTFCDMRCHTFSDGQTIYEVKDDDDVDNNDDNYDNIDDNENDYDNDIDHDDDNDDGDDDNDDLDNWDKN